MASTLAILAIRGVSVPQFGVAGLQVGRLTIDTRPAAAEVLIDGERRGVTPLTLSLAPGAHSITVRNGRDERVVPLTIAAGADVTQYFEMKTEPAVLSGGVSVTTVSCQKLPPTSVRRPGATTPIPLPSDGERTQSLGRAPPDRRSEP